MSTTTIARDPVADTLSPLSLDGHAVGRAIARIRRVYERNWEPVPPASAISAGLAECLEGVLDGIERLGFGEARVCDLGDLIERAALAEHEADVEAAQAWAKCGRPEPLRLARITPDTRLTGQVPIDDDPADFAFPAFPAVRAGYRPSYTPTAANDPELQGLALLSLDRCVGAEEFAGDLSVIA